MKKLMVPFMIATVVTMLAGCSPEISGVKNGYMTDFPQTKTGDLVAECFDNGSWSVEKKDGRTNVVFKGKVSKGLSQKAKSLAGSNEIWAMKLGEDYSKAEKDFENALYDEEKQMRETLTKQKASKTLDELESLTKEANILFKPIEEIKKQAEEVMNKADQRGRDYGYEDRQYKSLCDSYNELTKMADKRLYSLMTSSEKYIDIKNKMREKEAIISEVSKEVEKSVSDLHGKFYDRKRQFYLDYVSKKFYPLGEERTFVWVIMPDNKSFQMTTGDMIALGIMYGKYNQ